MIEDALYSRITTDPGISGIVGDRVYPLTMPDDSPLPVIIYTLVTGKHVENLQGSAGLALPLFQFDVFARTFPSMQDLLERLRIRLQGFRGVVSGVEVNGIQEWTNRHLFEPDTQLFRGIAECRVWYGEAVPS